MDIITQANLVKYMLRLSDRSKSLEPSLKYVMAKPTFDRSVKSSPVEKSTPEAQGVSSEYLCDFLNELRDDKTLDMHSVTIARNGKIICEGNFGVYDKTVWTVAHSLSKSVTGMAIGMLIDEGKLSLDDVVVRIFEKNAFSLNSLKSLLGKNITVRHLLTMTSGVTFNEAGVIVEEDWVKAFFESTIKTDPGKEFNYNSLNTYMLSAIVREITGLSLVDYLKPRLFDPLGIKNFYWQCCPKGIEAGGWGLYILPDDILKLGQLYLQKGVWNGKQLVPESWIRESCKRQIITDGLNGDYDYGYQVWCGKSANSFLFNGMFGQNMLAFPGTQTIIVTTAGNTEMFQQSNYFKIANKYFAGDYVKSDSPLPENKHAARKLENTIASLRGKTSEKGLSALAGRIFGKKPSLLPAQCAKYSGRVYDVSCNNAKMRHVGDLPGTKNISILPLCLQLISNNYTKGGISAISFYENEGKFFMNVSEAGKTLNIPIGFDKPELTNLTFGEETYITGIKGEFAQDEDGNDVLKIRLSFIETPNSRLIKIYFTENKLLVKFKENPGVQLVNLLLDYVLSSVESNKLLNTVISKVNADYLYIKTEYLFEPVFECTEKKKK